MGIDDGDDVLVSAAGEDTGGETYDKAGDEVMMSPIEYMILCGASICEMGADYEPALALEAGFAARTVSRVLAHVEVIRQNLVKAREKLLLIRAEGQKYMRGDFTALERAGQFRGELSLLLEDMAPVIDDNIRPLLAGFTLSQLNEIVDETELISTLEEGRVPDAAFEPYDHEGYVDFPEIVETNEHFARLREGAAAFMKGAVGSAELLRIIEAERAHLDGAIAECARDIEKAGVELQQAFEDVSEPLVCIERGLDMLEALTVSKDPCLQKWGVSLVADGLEKLHILVYGQDEDVAGYGVGVGAVGSPGAVPFPRTGVIPRGAERGAVTHVDRGPSHAPSVEASDSYTPSEELQAERARQGKAPSGESRATRPHHRSGETGASHHPDTRAQHHQSSASEKEVRKAVKAVENSRAKEARARALRKTQSEAARKAHNTEAAALRKKMEQELRKKAVAGTRKKAGRMAAGQILKGVGAKVAGRAVPVVGAAMTGWEIGRAVGENVKIGGKSVDDHVTKYFYHTFFKPRN